MVSVFRLQPGRTAIKLMQIWTYVSFGYQHPLSCESVHWHAANLSSFEFISRCNNFSLSFMALSCRLATAAMQLAASDASCLSATFILVSHQRKMLEIFTSGVEKAAGGGMMKVLNYFENVPSNFSSIWSHQRLYFNLSTGAKHTFAFYLVHVLPDVPSFIQKYLHTDKERFRQVLYLC